ncbi:MAG TPA: UDP-2,3-diacylglucosamine hydrolase [Prevotellaceae bacterium]|nr:UDP-2,3-diacylglucosamine hydrolase [Prevotellaceae bacterium]
MKNVYFLSDAHLGSQAIPHGRMRERRIVRFLDSIKNKASAVYMLGDMFDFWHEYRYVVPKGYTRFLGKISELTDSGVEVHFFTGNHDLWCGDYLEKECGVVLHRDSTTVEIHGFEFFLGHGDGLDKTDRKYLLLRAIFRNRICQKLFASIHPRWGMWFGLTWAAHSRKKHEKAEGYFIGAEKDGLVKFSRNYLKTHPDINYFIFGHRHVDVDLMLNKTARFVILGDWIEKFTFAVFDGQNLLLENYIEGETQF